MDPRLELSWDSYSKTISRGLSLLQQRGEFVDMTLAADGHYVKVHQMMMSLVSPYIKELITAANCPHPIIFLNRISYQTLQQILEYAYTGEVLLTRESLIDFMEAGKVLHIKGLEDDSVKLKANGALLNLTVSGDDENQPAPSSPVAADESVITDVRRRTETVENLQQSCDDFTMDETHLSDDGLDDHEVEMMEPKQDDIVEKAKQKQQAAGSTTVQYSLSCHGKINVILNRFIYRLRHARKNNTNLYRCVEYNNKGCPAYVIMKGDIVLQRGCAHDHPFHDRQILKRVHAGNLYTKLKTVETIASLKANTKAGDKRKSDDSDDCSAGE